MAGIPLRTNKKTAKNKRQEKNNSFLHTAAKINKTENMQG
jgi:hypothetical protein